MTSFNVLQNNLNELSLLKMAEILPNVIDKSVKENISLQDSLLELTSAEIAFRDERARKINVTVSHFPYIKTIKDFDFSYQPTINKNQVMDFMSLRFIESKSNIIFIGSSGVGKTHLATAIGIEAASKRISTYFINFAVLMEQFKQAAKENRVEKVVKHYLKYTVLIIDEIGYLPVDKDAAFGFFQLIAARYEFRPTILTTNQPFSKRPDVFGDAVIANAIIDRLVHHCDIVKITGHSYRIKGRNILMIPTTDCPLKIVHFKVIQFQIPIFSHSTKGQWILRFDDILADALELGGLKNKDFPLSDSIKDYIERNVLTPSARPAAELLIKYYIANKPDDSDKVVLPSTNIDAYFGNGNFSKKWLPKELDSVIIRDPQSNGVSRYTLHENLISLI